MNPAAVGGLLLVDTEVLINDLRDEPGAVAFLEATEQPQAASAITIAKLYLGVRDGVKRRRLDAFVEALEMLPWSARRQSWLASGAGSMAQATARA